MYYSKLMKAFAVLLAVVFPVVARAGDVWRMAGSFNGWNANDDGWAMQAKGESGLLHVLERPMSAGVHAFKFVRNGDWAQGHFGASAAGEGLEQPGGNLTLRVVGAGVYRVTLNLQSRTWSVLAVKAERTVLDVRVQGAAIDGRAVLIDASRTLTVDGWDRGRLTLDAPAGRISGIQYVDRVGKQLRAVVSGLGPMRLVVRLRDAGEVFEKAFDLDVEAEARLSYATAGDRNNVRTVVLEPVGAGVRRAVVAFASDTELTAVEVSAGVGEAVRTENVRVPAGLYAVEMRDGAVVTQRDPSFPMMFIPGEWRSFVFTPRDSADAVHLTGDFTGWARGAAAVGQPGAIEMAARNDGSFFTIVNLPMGALRYRFIVDGSMERLDPSAQVSAVGPGGGPASVVMVGPGVDEFPAAKANAIERRGVRHDPSSALDFTAISRALGLADISLTALPGDVQRVVMTVEVASAEGRKRAEVSMVRSPAVGGFDRWSARVMTGEAMALYSFTLTDGTESVKVGPFSASIEPGLELPAWAMGAVWYQIFPERFRNGNPLNDPTGPGVFNKPWTDDWRSITPEEEKAWRERYKVPMDEPMPARKGGDFFNVVWDRRYGGDLQGVAEKFGYLRDLGVGAIYFNPIFEAESMHKYDATDYRHIDDNLSTPAGAGRVGATAAAPAGEGEDPKTWGWTAGDRYFVEEFLPGAKKAGLRVVLDGVFNHTGRPFFAFRDIEDRGEASAYKDWFFVKFDENGALKSWESWFNTGALPKLRQTANGDLVEPVKRHIFGITRRWMDPNGDGNPADGIDGWRLDVALDVGQPFWRDWRALVKGINPEALIIAEIWDDASPHVTGETFDTQMNYPFARPVTDWVGVKPGMTARALEAGLMSAFDDLPQTNLIHQNLLGSHDTDRFVSMLLNPGREYDQGNRPQDHDYPYRDVKPGRELYRRSLLGVALQAMYMGAPMVYYGDEVGMWGADDPSDRKPFPWDDLAGGAMKNADERANWELRKEYAKWFNLRRDQRVGAALRYGSLRHLDSGEPNVFAFERALNGVRVVAVINRQDRAYATVGLVEAAPGGPVRVEGESAAWWVSGGGE